METVRPLSLQNFTSSYAEARILRNSYTYLPCVSIVRVAFFLCLSIRLHSSYLRLEKHVEEHKIGEIHWKSSCSPQLSTTGSSILARAQGVRGCLGKYIMSSHNIVSLLMFHGWETICVRTLFLSPPQRRLGPGGVLPYNGLMGTWGQPGYVFRDFCLKRGIDFINFCLKQGIFS